MTKLMHSSKAKIERPLIHKVSDQVWNKVWSVTIRTRDVIEYELRYKN